MAKPNPQLAGVREELTAYLDGELDIRRANEVEERLGRDDTYRQELQRLQGAWDLLDRLPRATVGASFTQTTVQLVTQAAEQEVRSAASDAPRRRQRQILAVAGTALVAALVGLAVGSWIWPSPNKQLLRDLPAIENLEIYQQADSIEFVRMLEDEKLFPEESEHGK